MKKLISLPVFLLASAFFTIQANALPTYEVSVIASDNPDAPHLRFQGLNDKGQILGTAYSVDSVPNECLEGFMCADVMIDVLGARQALLWQFGKTTKYASATVGLGLNNTGDVLLSAYPAEYQLHTQEGIKTTTAAHEESTFGFQPQKLLDNGVVLGVQDRPYLSRVPLYGSFVDLNFNAVPNSVIYGPVVQCEDILVHPSWVEWDGEIKAIRNLPVSINYSVIDTNKLNQLLVTDLQYVSSNYCHDPLVDPMVYAENTAVINPDNSIRYVKTADSAIAYLSGSKSTAVAINTRGDVLFVDGSIVRANGAIDNSARQERPAVNIGAKILLATDFNDRGLVLFKEVTVSDLLESFAPVDLLDSFIPSARSFLVLYVPNTGLQYLNFLANELTSSLSRFNNHWFSLPASKPKLNARGDIAFSCGDDVEKICFLKNTDAYTYQGRMVKNINLPGCVKKKRNNAVELSLDLGKFLLKNPSASAGYSGNFKVVKSQEKYSPVIDRKSTQLIVKELNAQASNNCRVKNVSPQIQTAILDKKKSIMKIAMKYKVSYMVKGHKKNGTYQLDASMPINGQLPE
jgi:hypothetical protein